MEANDQFPPKAEFPIERTPEGITIEAKEQFEKAFSPMLSRQLFSPKETLPKLMHHSKAEAPIERTPSGIATEVIASLWEKACSPIEATGTLSPSRMIDSGMLTSVAEPLYLLISARSSPFGPEIKAYSKSP